MAHQSAISEAPNAARFSIVVLKSREVARIAIALDVTSMDRRYSTLSPPLCQAQRLYTPELMELAMIGLGRMGGNMTDRLMRGGHRVVAYDLNAAAVDRAAAGGAI